MKTSLSLVCLIALASSFSIACGDDGGPAPLTGGTTGSGGETGSGNSTGSGGGGEQPNVLFEGNGTWVNGADNTVGIQGAFFILEDGVKDGTPVGDTLMHTDFTADTGALEECGVSKFSSETVKPCISGTAVQVTDETGATGCNASAAEDVAGACQWSAQWGGGIGLNLNETGEGPNGEESVKSPYNANENMVKGFTFVASGDAGGATLRVKATNAGSEEDFCKAFTIVPGTPVTVQWSDLKHQCWGSTGTQVLDLTNLEALQWQVVTDQNDPHTVTNLCIESISWF